MSTSRINYVNNYLNELSLSKEILSYYKDKNILITGGAGAIGSNLLIGLSNLVGQKGRIIILDNLSSIKYPEPWNVESLSNVIFVFGDIRNDIDLKRVFHYPIDIVFHLAAFFANQNSIDYPETAAEVDIIGLIKTLEYSLLSKVKRFVYASSGCAIYGSYPKLPLLEDFISMHLTTPYQINKMTGEMICNFYYHQYTLNTVNCRFFNSYGPGEVPGQYRNVIPNFIYWSLQGIDIPITGTGEETRDFTYVLDLVQGLIKAGYYENAIGENFNLASATETRIIDLAHKIIEYTGNKSSIKFLSRRKWDTKPRLLAAIGKAKKLIDYKPLVDFETGLRSNINWFEENWDSICKYADFKPGLSSALEVDVTK